MPSRLAKGKLRFKGLQEVAAGDNWDTGPANSPASAFGIFQLFLALPSCSLASCHFSEYCCQNCPRPLLWVSVWLQAHVLLSPLHGSEVSISIWHSSPPPPHDTDKPIVLQKIFLFPQRTSPCSVNSKLELFSFICPKYLAPSGHWALHTTWNSNAQGMARCPEPLSH